MASRKYNKLPQEGTATNSGGESLTGSLESVCPSYSGGGNDRYKSPGSFDPRRRTTDTDFPTNEDDKEVPVDHLLVKKTDTTRTRRARVTSTHCPSSTEDIFALAKAADLSDTEETDMSCETVTSQASLSSNRFWRKRARDAPGSGSSDDLVSLAKTPSKRGRGRPPTTGKYVGLAKAKAELNAAKAEELRLDAERELANELAQKRATRAAIFRKSPVLPAEGRAEPETLDLEKVVRESLDTISHVAKTSGRLKGTYVRALNEAADALKVSFTELRVRTATEEVARLEAANARLAAELNELRKEIAGLQSAATPAPAPKPTLTTDEVVRAVMAQCGALITSRFGKLEELLLPERRLRPPLAADRRRSTAAPEAARAASPRAASPPHVEPTTVEAVPATTTRRPPGKNPKVPPSGKNPRALAPEPPQKGKKKKKAEPQPLPARPRPQPQPQSQSADGEWTVASRSGRKKKKPKGKGSSQQTPAKKTPKLRAPRTTAVVLTLQPEALELGVTYGKVLSEAKRRINVAELGISGVQFRTTATGARLLKLPGAASADKANALASKLKETFGEDVVRVSRPEKCAEMRVTGLDDSATKEEVVEAVAKTGGCTTEAIKAGEIVRHVGRQGTMWLRCPVAAAKKAAQKRLLVGWASVRAVILQPRPLRCFRCLEPGHLGANCVVGIDRSKLCFRCGKGDHTATLCTAQPHCPACEVAGKPADHPIGTKACSVTPPKKGKKEKKPAGEGPRAPSPPAQRPTPRAEKAMDVGN